MWNEKHVLFFFKNWKNHNLIILYVKKKLFLSIILHENHDLFIIS